MIKALYQDKETVLNILCQSFDENKSVNYVTKQDHKRKERVRVLMEYSFEVCYLFGNVFMNTEKTAVALILYPERKKTTAKTILLDLKLALFSIGIKNIFKVLDRESKIKQHHPKTPILYLWFIGVENGQQKRGIGSKLLKEIIEKGTQENREIYLETSTLVNIPWYQKHGFSIYKELEFSYKLFILKK